jgi:nucleoside-diphosphate-sugar epimerase
MPKSHPLVPDEHSRKVLFTGASSGLGSDVLRRIRALIEMHSDSERLDFLTAGRRGQDDYFFDLSDINVAELRGIHSIVHFAWDRADISSDTKNVSGTINLLAAAKACDANFVFISSIESECGRSMYAKHKQACERLVSDYGGVVLRLGAVVGGEHDLYARLKHLLRVGPLGFQVRPDPRMRVTSIEKLVEVIYKHLVQAEPGHVEDLTDSDTQSLSSLLELDRSRLRIAVPYRLAENALRLAGFFVPRIRVWHDRILALAPT